jgi:hypothetical protein
MNQNIQTKGFGEYIGYLLDLLSINHNHPKDAFSEY